MRYRRLYRSRTERMLTGVCGGVARYLNADPTAVRVGFVLLAVLTGGLALLAYPLMWVVMPEEPALPPAPPPAPPSVLSPPVVAQPAAAPPAQV